MKTFWKAKQIVKKKDMNWAEAKWRYPKLKPNKDYDGDGVKNQFDCKPFDRKRQHDAPRYGSDSKWKLQMTEDFSTVGDFKHFAEGKRKTDD